MGIQIGSGFPNRGLNENPDQKFGCADCVHAGECDGSSHKHQELMGIKQQEVEEFLKQKSTLEKENLLGDSNVDDLQKEEKIEEPKTNDQPSAPKSPAPEPEEPILQIEKLNEESQAELFKKQMDAQEILHEANHKYLESRFGSLGYNAEGLLDIFDSEGRGSLEQFDESKAEGPGTISKAEFAKLIQTLHIDRHVLIPVYDENGEAIFYSEWTLDSDGVVQWDVYQLQKESDKQSRSAELGTESNSPESDTNGNEIDDLDFDSTDDTETIDLPAYTYATSFERTNTESMETNGISLAIEEGHSIEETAHIKGLTMSYLEAFGFTEVHSNAQTEQHAEKTVEEHSEAESQTEKSTNPETEVFAEIATEQTSHIYRAEQSVEAAQEQSASITAQQTPKQVEKLSPTPTLAAKQSPTESFVSNPDNTPPTMQLDFETGETVFTSEKQEPFRPAEITPIEQSSIVNNSTEAVKEVIAEIPTVKETITETQEKPITVRSEPVPLKAEKTEFKVTETNAPQIKAPEIKMTVAKEVPSYTATPNHPEASQPSKVRLESEIKLVTESIKQTESALRALTELRRTESQRPSPGNSSTATTNTDENDSKVTPLQPAAATNIPTAIAA